MNFRQKEVLLEAILHSNAEFTYGIHVHRYDVSYPCARSDQRGAAGPGFPPTARRRYPHFSSYATDNSARCSWNYP